MSQCLHRVFILASIWFLAVPALAQDARPSSERRYSLADGSVLVLSVPAGWNDEVRRGDARTLLTVALRPGSGPGFAVLVSPIRLAKQAAAAPVLEEIRRGVQSAADGARAQAVEKSIVAVELKGPAARGYYFSATDRAPKPGEFKYLTQGTLALGEIRVAFTILTNDGQRAVSDAALEMLRTARLAKAAGDAR